MNPYMQSKSSGRLARAAEYLSAFWTISDGNVTTFTRMVAEALALRARRGVQISYYLTGALGRAPLNWQEKLGYVGPKAYERMVWSLNDPDYRKISQNKLTEKALLQALSIPTAEFLGYFHPQDGSDTKGRPLRTPNELAQFLADCGERKICFKQTESWNGAGFIPVSIGLPDDNRWLEISGRGAVSCGELHHMLSTGTGYVIERYIDQHSAYAAYHPNSINGYRFWVAQNADGRVTPLIANLRFGCGGALTDNSAGRVLVDVDITSGILGTAHLLTYTNDTTSVHPDTGIQLTGEHLPMFHEAKQLACDALRIFPETRFAGVDIAMSKDGPVVLELNVQPSFLAPALSRRPIRELLDPFLSETEANT